MQIKDSIERRLRAYAYRRDRVSRKINFLAGCRLVTFILMILGFSFAFDSTMGLQGVALFLTASAVFLYLMVVHDRCYRFKTRCELTEQMLRDDLARVTFRFADIEIQNPIHFSSDHPFAHDLDFSGPISMLKLIDNTFHIHAKDLLKRWIDEPGSVADIEARQEAVADLSAHKRFRLQQALAAHLDSDCKLDPAGLADWLQQKTPWTLSTGMYWLGRFTSLVTTSVIVLHFFFGIDLPGLNWFWLLVLNLVFFQAMDQVHKKFLFSFMSYGKSIAATCAVIRTFEQTPVKASLLRKLKARVMADGKAAGPNLRKLIGLNELLQYRSNGFAHFFLNGLLLWDQHFLRRLAHWRDQYGDQLQGWVETVFEIEALDALANYHWLYPERPFPELVDEDTVLVEAEAMAHPAIDDAVRVGNDYRLETCGKLHLITGSNMSGKSTFLRTIGVNLVLARLGVPVCAERMTCSLPHIWTSIRIQDDLAQGVSYFYAEVRRIKKILDEVGEDKGAVLYLMDEILKGTNSRERLIATKAMVRYLIDHRSSGLITTHDLELLAVRDEHPDAISNFHFRERVENDEMFFDYKMREGQLTSTNALRVMHFAGVPLDFGEEGSGQV